MPVSKTKIKKISIVFYNAVIGCPKLYSPVLENTAELGLIHQAHTKIGFKEGILTFHPQDM